MRFRPENGDVIFADSQDFTYKRRDQQASIMTQWCSRSVYSVEGISPDGQYLALVSYGLQGYVILLNINAGQIIGVYPASYVNHLRFSADGRKIFVMAKNGLINWTGRARLIRRQLFVIPNMAMWLVSLNRKKKGMITMPQSSMRKYVLLMQDTSGTSTFTCSQTHQHSGKTKQCRQHPQRPVAGTCVWCESGGRRHISG